MKTLTPAVAAILSQNLGIEPVNILAVQWTEGGNFVKYGDKRISQEELIDGVILELSNLEAVIKLDSEGQTQGIQVTLDDTNGTIKDIINVNDIHGRTVRLLQWFEGLPLSEAFQLYEGEISSPIQWNEGDRTVSFSVITKLADKEVGFSPEEAQFEFLPTDLVGKPWPMCFGTVQNVPATRLHDVPLTQSTEDLGVSDPSIVAHGSLLGSDEAVLERWIDILTLAIIQAANNRDTTDPQAREYWQNILEQLQDQLGQVVLQLIALQEEQSRLRAERRQQLEEENDTIEVANGNNFPQGTTIRVAVDGIELVGVMVGNTFQINERFIDGYHWQDGDSPWFFTWIQGGANFRLVSEGSEILYIANIIQSVVHSVQVHRETENGRILVTIPQSYYTVRYVTSGPYTFTVLAFEKALSSIDETLDNDIYVTLTSSIGPNTVDIMKWLISTYTDLTWDNASFNHVELMLENYPSHFAMLERKNILIMLEEMAMQSRCAIWLNNGIFYLKYLSEELTEDLAITESDIDAGSMVLGTTDTEELVTKLVATWTDNYVLEEPHKIILRHNIKKYGTREREINFYIYNINQLVFKSATFWLIRLANIWKKLYFNTYVHNLVMETFDTLLLNFNTNYVANGAVKALVNDLTYDTTSGLLNVTCWVPVKFGEMGQYDFSWPSQVSINWEFPTGVEVAKGYDGSDGPGEEVVIEEITTPSATGNPNSYFFANQYGERRPSDLDDEKPEPRFPFTTYEPGEDPSRPYDYNRYPYQPTTPIPPEEFIGAVFPGRVAAKGDVYAIGKVIYEVDVYDNSLQKEPRRLKVIQLQIQETEEIPTGTWCLVTKNLTEIVNEDTKERAPGLNEDNYEWSMQVPVWL